MTKLLHLIRHGESKANASGIYQGQSFDTALTDKGKRQARAVGKILKLARANKIYTSPLLRTKETAEIINRQMQVELVYDERLLEINHGSWEGKTAEQFDEQENELLKQWRKNPVGVKMIGGESIQDVVARCVDFVASIEDDQFVVVTHDLVVRVIASMAIKHDFAYLWKYTLDNCGITTVSFDPYRLISLNQNFHLNNLRSKLNRQAM